MHASGCAVWPQEGNGHLWLISIPRKGWSFPSCVWASCAKVFSICALTNFFSSCFRGRTSFGCYLTVKTMVEFISIYSYHKLPASFGKHWVIMPTHLVPKVSHWGCCLWKRGEWVVCFTTVLVFLIDWQGQPARDVPLEDILCWLSRISCGFHVVLSAWCPLVSYSPRMHINVHNSLISNSQKVEKNKMV